VRRCEFCGHRGLDHHVTADSHLILGHGWDVLSCALCPDGLCRLPKAA
jgi:hypothetical protein